MKHESNQRSANTSGLLESCSQQHESRLQKNCVVRVSSVEAFKNLIGVEYPQVFFREGQGSSSELHAYSLMAAVVSSQEVPLFRRGLRAQHGSRAASTRSVNCAAAPCEAARLRAGLAAAPEEQFLLHADSVLASLTL